MLLCIFVYLFIYFINSFHTCMRSTYIVKLYFFFSWKSKTTKDIKISGFTIIGLNIPPEGSGKNDLPHEKQVITRI